MGWGIPSVPKDDTDEKWAEYYRQLILVSSFIGAFAFAALVLFLGQYNSITALNSEQSGHTTFFVPFIIFDLGAISGSFIVSSVLSIRFAAGLKTPTTNPYEARWAAILVTMGYTETLLIIPALASIISVWIALALVGFIGLTYLTSRKMRKRDKARAGKGPLSKVSNIP